MTKTYNEIYIKARRALKDAGIEPYGLEARIIVAGAAGKTQAALMRDLSLYCSGDLENTVDKLIERRLTGEPVAYLTNCWEFYGISLLVNRDVLIPRPETEMIVKAAVELFSGRNGTPRILDLCAGSGCIGCALSVQMPGAHLVMVDNDAAALRVCRENVLRNNLGLRAMCIEADATKKPPMLLGNFDLLVCNAPYIPTAEIETLDASVRDYEPHQALDGGKDGLNIIRPVVSLWKSVLKSRGTIMLEVGEGQAGDVMQLLAAAGFTRRGALKDTNGTDRIVIGQF